jgi:tetratricopeptide (TPR) repeat protein
MKDDISTRARELFKRLSELPPEEKSQKLEHECAKDPEVRAEVEALLRSFEEAGSFLETPALGSYALEASDDGIQDPVGRKIDDFTVHRVLATGGMGAVYEAQQDSPSRRVALKILKPSAVSPSTLRRFEFESEILARLRHPGIAQIYAAGSFKNHRGVTQPYFAMEFIPEALPIVEFANAKRLNREERVKLFATVAEAVHHGHQKGVIHRDLKPGNILVDASGQARIIDFGVARSTHSDFLTESAQTRTGQIIGTLSYMSPEQCEGDPDNLDTRSDVYSLGVVLYELLCGELPYAIQGVGLITGARMIREQTPRRPRRTDPTLPSDLEAILLKALEKEALSRYQSAAGFTADLRRFLRNEPVLAKPQSRIYSLRVFARRNRAFVGSLVTLFLVLIAATIISAGFAIEKNKEAQRRQLAETAAAGRAAEAKENEALAGAVNEFLLDMFGQANPRLNPHAKNTTIRQAADFAAQKIARAPLDPPVVEGLVQNVLADIYRGLGVYEVSIHHNTQAIAIFQSELGPNHERTLRAVDRRGAILRSIGKFHEALAVYEDLVPRIREHQPASRLLLSALNTLAMVQLAVREPDKALAVAKEALALGPGVIPGVHDQLAESHQNLGGVLQKTAQWADAERQFRIALGMRRELYGELHSTVAQSMNSLASVLDQLGRLEEAEDLARQTVTITEKLYENGHPLIGQALNNLGCRLSQHGKLQEAVSCYERAVQLWRKAWPQGHPELSAGMANLAGALHALGRFREAELLYGEALQGLRELYGDIDDLQVAESLEGLANAIGKQGRHRESLAFFEQAISMYRALDGRYQENIGRSLISLATQYDLLGQLDHAEPHYRQAIAVLEPLPSPPPGYLIRARHGLAVLLTKKIQPLPRHSLDRASTLVEAASLLRRSGQLAEAVSLIKEALESYQSADLQDSPPALQARSVYGACLMARSLFDEAEHHLLHAFWGLDEAEDVQEDELRAAMERLVELYEAWEDPDEAEAWLFKIEEQLAPSR